jgi:hypothetical protein
MVFPDASESINIIIIISVAEEEKIKINMLEYKNLNYKM